MGLIRATPGASAESGLRPPVDDALCRAIVEAVPDGILVVSSRGAVISANPRAEAMLGYSRGELVGIGLEQLLPERHRQAYLAKRARYAVAPREQPLGSAPALMALRKDGIELPAEVGLSPISSPEGTLTVIVVRDISARLAAERELREANERTRLLIDEAPVGLLVTDLEGRYIDANAAACRMLGYECGELIGMSVRELIPPEDIPRLEAAKKQLSTPGTTHIAEWQMKRKDGRWVSVEVSGSILPDGRWQAFVQDISDRKQAEQALRESEAQLRRAQHLAHLGSWEWDLRTGKSLRSPEIQEIFGLEANDRPLRAVALLHQIPADQRQQVFDAVSEAVRAGRPYSVEHRVIRPDGTERVVLQQGEPVIEDGVVVKITGTVLDITKLRTAEREREAALSELKAVLEECPVGINIVRDGGRRVEPNAMTRKMLAASVVPYRSISQLVGRVLTPAGEPVPYDQLPAVQGLAGQRVEPRELLLELSDGRRRPIEVSAAPVFAPDGKVSSVVIVWRDISQLKEMERLRSEWNSVVAHDLRQPVNNIHMFTQLLARQPVEWSAQAQLALNQIKKMTERLARMTFDLLDLSRLDVGRLPLEKKQVDLASLARDCIARASLEAPDRSLELRIAEPLPAVEGDPDRLTQVLENLLSNAIKYGAPGTPVEVDLGCDGQLLTVSVTNQGKGIEPSEIERVFERFQRIHAGKGGVGLGLSITKGLVEAHGGHIGVQSVPGGTTTFWFTLPAAKG